jgi:hypothetical protein
MSRFEAEVVEQGLESQWKFWQDNYGFKVLPKRSPVTPSLSNDILISLYGEDKLDISLSNLSTFAGFINKTPIADQFAGNHHARRAWQGSLSREFLPLFLLE